MALAAMNKYIGQLFGVRVRELSRIVPLTTAYGLVMGSLYMLKPVRNALFLDRLGVEQLPYVLMLVALVGGGAALLFSRLASAFRLDRLVLGTFLLLILCLLGFWLALPLGWSWLYYLFYTWVNLYGLMATSLLWLMANAVFNAREGRRLFGLIGTAGIVGAVVGGAFTSWIAPIVGTENLLLVCAGVLAVALLFLYPLRAREATDTSRDEGEDTGVLSLIGRTELLQLLGGMAAMVAIVAAIIDVQFNHIVNEVFVSKDEKTAFFGQFFAYLSAFAFLFQVMVTPRVLRRLGVIPALLFLPASMALGSAAVLLGPGLTAAVLVKLGDGGFRHSIHRSATELLYLPVPREIKRRTKVLLDTTVDNVATGLGALVVLVALHGLGLSYQHLSYLSLGLIALWLVVVGRGRRVYVDAFRQAIDRREIDLSDYTVDIAEAATLDGLVNALASPQAGRVVYALEMLAPVRAARLVEPVVELLSHVDVEVRCGALRVLANQTDIGVSLSRIEELVGDDDLRVRVEALHILCQHGEGDRTQLLRQALASPDRKRRGAAVGCIAEHGSEDEHELVDEASVRELLVHESENPEEAAGELADRVQAARIIGALPEPGSRPYLREVMRQLKASQEVPVVLQTIESLGQQRDPEHVPWLLERLRDWRYRRAARVALAGYGAAVLPEMRSQLKDEQLDVLTRSRASRVVADIPEQASVDLLVECLDVAGPQLQYRLIKSLSKLRSARPDLDFDDPRLDAALRETAESYCSLFQVLRQLESDPSTAGARLLVKAMREKQMVNLERIFRFLGLTHPAQDMYNAYLGYVSGEPRTRASALEFLDNVLSRELQELLVPLLDASSPEAVASHGERHFGTHLRTRQEAIGFLLRSSDPWLRACAAYASSGTDPGESWDGARAMRHDPDPVVRETVDLVLRQATGR